MADATSPPPDSQRAAATATSSSAVPNPPPAAAVRYRLPQRPDSRNGASQSPDPSRLLRRRSSLLSFSSVDDAAQSFADDIINPRTSRQRKTNNEHEVTHWHSTPLAFAILPAMGGLLFKNGSAFITDIFILGLAAVFLNWSIRLPWDWYYSAQALRGEAKPDLDDTIFEEPEPDEVAVETASSVTSSPNLRPTDRISDVGPRETPRLQQKREQAAADLRAQEIMALTATFVFPILAAYFLHVVRAQLSGPSSGLVSDYNLSVFLLAAEIRPVRQLFRLVGERTLHLQRTVTGLEDPFNGGIEEKKDIATLAQRIAELEAKLSEHALVPNTVSVAQKADVSELSAELKKRYEPRLEGLERAVRRYEKRSTTLAMLTEQRLQALENRTNDAFSLAAVAAQHSQSQGVLGSAFDSIMSVAKLPLSIAWGLCLWPFVMVEELYAKLKALLVGPAPVRPSKRNPSSRHGGSGTDDRSSKARMPFRKAVR